MAEESEVRGVVMGVVNIVDLFDSYPHKVLHQNAEDFALWCESSLSPEGTKLLILFLQSIPCGFDHSIKDILDRMRNEHGYHG